jgi:hypothetical protein
MTIEQDHIETGTEEARTLWVLSKDGHTMTCVVSGRPGHEELQVLFDREVYLSETHTVHEGTIARAEVLHRGFEAHGWTALPANSPPQE